MTNASTLTTPSDGRKVWQKNAYDVANQTTSNATNVGYLRKNDSRVDIISTMDKNLKQQVFSFTNMTTAATQLSVEAGSSSVASSGGSSSSSGPQGTNAVRVQVLNQAGQVIADSKSGMGQASKTYTALTQGTYSLKAGTYSVVVQRNASVPLDSQLPYNVQVAQGSTVKNDYITNNVPEPAKIQQEQAVAAAQQIAPTVLSSTSTSLFGSTSSDPYGLNGYNIFGQKTTT